MMSRLREHPSLLWLLPLGCTILAPMLISVILFIFSFEILSAGANAIGAFIFSALFAVVAVLAVAFWQAVVVQAFKKSHLKSFRLIDAFKDIRPVFWRSVVLILIGIAWIAVFSVPLLFVNSLLLEILLGLILLITPFIFLQAAFHLDSHGVIRALHGSALKTFTSRRLRDWMRIKYSSIVILAIVLLGAHPLLADVAVAQLVRIVLSFVALSWFAVFSPFFGFALMLGGNGIPHVLAVFVASLLLWFAYVGILTRKI